VEKPIQDEYHHVTHRVSPDSKMTKANLESHNFALASDEFDADMLDNDSSNEQNIDEDDEASNTHNEEETNKALVGTGGEDNDSIVPQSLVHVCDVPTCSRIGWTLYYTEEELRALKLKHSNLREFPNHKDISRIGSVVCDSALMSEEGNPRITDEVIKKG
jgi:hypothetical protein